MKSNVHGTLLEAGCPAEHVARVSNRVEAVRRVLRARDFKASKTVWMAPATLMLGEIMCRKVVQLPGEDDEMIMLGAVRNVSHVSWMPNGSHPPFSVLPS